MLCPPLRCPGYKAALFSFGAWASAGHPVLLAKLKATFPAAMPSRPGQPPCVLLLGSLQVPGFWSPRWDLVYLQAVISHTLPGAHGSVPSDSSVEPLSFLLVLLAPGRCRPGSQPAHCPPRTIQSQVCCAPPISSVHLLLGSIPFLLFV